LNRSTPVAEKRPTYGDGFSNTFERSVSLAFKSDWK